MPRIEHQILRAELQHRQALRVSTAALASAGVLSVLVSRPGVFYAVAFTAFVISLGFGLGAAVAVTDRVEIDYDPPEFARALRRLLLAASAALLVGIIAAGGCIAGAVTK